MSGRNDLPFADFSRRLGEAFIHLSDDLIREASDHELILASPDPDVEDSLEAILSALGPRQQQIVQLSGLTDEEGLKTAEIAAEIDYEVPNTYSTLQALRSRGVVEAVPGASPARWRLSARFRSAEPYLGIARHVQPGEWTTYGDISIAVRGDKKAARAVGRAAAKLGNFPNPHRVLREGGLIPEGWRTQDGQGPDECRRRLEGEGVSFTKEGRAAQAQRVAWDTLVERAEQTE